MSLGREVLRELGCSRDRMRAPALLTQEIINVSQFRNMEPVGVR